MTRERRVNYKTKETRRRRFFGKRNGFGREILFRKNAKTHLMDTKEVNRAILGEFKIQDDVKMYGHVPDIDDFLSLICRAHRI